MMFTVLVWLKRLFNSRARRLAEQFCAEADRVLREFRQGRITDLVAANEIKRLHETVRKQLVGEAGRKGATGGRGAYQELVRPKLEEFQTEFEVLRLSRKLGPG